MTTSYWNLPAHSAGEPGHDHPDPAQLVPAHPYVLLPQPPLLCGFLLFFDHCSQDAGEPCWFFSDSIIVCL